MSLAPGKMMTGGALSQHRPVYRRKKTREAFARSTSIAGMEQFTENPGAGITVSDSMSSSAHN